MSDGAAAKAPPRKRCGRPPKKATATTPTLEVTGSSSNDTIQSEELSVDEANVSVLAISPLLEDAQNSSSMSPVPMVQECRRSSRKKIVKFDVRDLLTKNRKNHRIHIEAHLDSNAPSTSTSTTWPARATPNATAATPGSVESASPQTAAAAAATQSADLENKRKVFLEKSAIFRRFSTDQQNRLSQKVPPIPHMELPISILPNSSSREFMVQKGGNTALDSAVEEKTKKPVGRRKKVTAATTTTTTVSDTKKPKAAQAQPADQGAVAPKRRGRPPKNRSLIETTVTTRSSSPVDNERLNSTIVVMESVEGTDGPTLATAEFVADPLVIETMTIDDMDDDLVEEVKEELSELPMPATGTAVAPHENVSLPPSEESAKLLEAPHHMPLGENPSLTDIILEISSSSSMEASPTRSHAYVKASKQRNFAAVSFMQESSNTDDEIAAGPEFIVAAVEEIELEQTITSATERVQQIDLYMPPKTEVTVAESVRESACQLVDVSFESANSVGEPAATKCATVSPTISISSTLSSSMERPNEEEITQKPKETSEVENESVCRQQEEEIISSGIEIFLEEVVEETIEDVSTDENVVEVLECSQSTEQELIAQMEVTDERPSETSLVEEILVEKVLAVEPLEEPLATNECKVEETPTTTADHEPNETLPIPSSKCVETEQSDDLKTTANETVETVLEKPTVCLEDAKESPKELITLPLKKQTEKLKQFSEQEEHTTAASENRVPNNIQLENVSVNTNTLLDILKTVQSNATTANTSPSSASASDTVQHVQLDVDEKSMSPTASLQRYAGPLDKTHVRRFLNRIRRSESPRSTDTITPEMLQRVMAITKETHKTVQEAFDQIAAESAKFVFDMKVAYNYKATTSQTLAISDNMAEDCAVASDSPKRRGRKPLQLPDVVHDEQPHKLQAIELVKSESGVKEEKIELRQPPKKRLSRLHSMYEELESSKQRDDLNREMLSKDEIDLKLELKSEDVCAEVPRMLSPTSSKSDLERSRSPSHERTQKKRKHVSSRKSSSPSSKKIKSKSKSTKRSSKTLTDKKSRQSKRQAGVEVHVEEILDEAQVKKQRQQRLRAAFEAALRGEEVVSEPLIREIATMNRMEQEEKSGVKRQLFDDTLFPNANDDATIHPLSDIEKFINDGENLLKGTAAFKEGEDAEIHDAAAFLDNVPQISQAVCLEGTHEFQGASEQEMMALTEMAAAVASYVQSQEHHISYETPADTPNATPSVTPPPTYDTMYDELTGVRRSHRLKQISKTSKLVGRGLVRDKERFSLKDGDGETKGHYTLDDHLTDLAQVEAKNAKFLKEMEERLSNFQVIKENEYICERVISREARKMICDCFLTADEEERGELGCGEDCLNRLLMIECGPSCNVKERCTNRRFQRLLCSPCRVFRTEKKGFGILADIQILPGEFIMEYVGEVIDGDEFERRRVKYSREKNRHYYFMALRSDTIIDATSKGNISRFINHSCDPNAETQKWTVNGELRIGFFSRKSIMPGEEITFNYQYQRYGREAQRCYCESTNCRGWIGEEPNSDEGEQIDDDSDDDQPGSREASDSDDMDSSDESLNDEEELKEATEVDAQTKKSKRRLKKKTEEEDSTQKKFDKLMSKISKKVAKAKKQTEAKGGKKQAKLIALEDPDIEDEVLFLRDCGMKNQADTLRFSRLMVRAKLKNTRINLLEVLREAELPCRRLFLDYHGLPLLHGWMSEDGSEMPMRMRYLDVLKLLPMGNKTMLTDSKVYQTVQSWRDEIDAAALTDEESDDESGRQSAATEGEKPAPDASIALVASDPQREALKTTAKLARKLMKKWDRLPEIFRIPKRERIEQMKEHEREADRQYAEQVDSDDEYTDPRTTHADRYERDRFGRSLSRFMKPHSIGVLGTLSSWESAVARRRLEAAALDESTKHLSKDERRQMFAAKAAETRMAEDRFEYEMKCRFFGLDPKTTHPDELPFCVNPDTGEWYSVNLRPIAAPPNYALAQFKPQSTNPEDYYLPAAVAQLPEEWRFAISSQGHVYYFHVRDRIPQWEPPTPDQYHGIGDADDSDSDGGLELKLGSSSEEDDNDEELVHMEDAQLRAYIEQKVKARRTKRLKQLVDSRPISPRREEDRIYNQNEVRKYKENKEKIRKRKEEIRRRKAEALTAAVTAATTAMDTAVKADSAESPKPAVTEADDDDGVAIVGALPIQDYLLSSDEEDRIKEECNNSPLIDVIVRGDKIVDELDALTTNRRLRRPLPPHGDPADDGAAAEKTPKDDARDTSGETANGAASASAVHTVDKHELKRRKLDKKEKKKSRESEASKYRRLKEKFRCEIAGVVTQYLKPFRKETCTMGRICSDDDFNHLAKKLTHFVMIKELRYCEGIGQTLECSDSVKNKTREFIKKYMVKYGEVYVKPTNDPDFKDIPFKL